MDHQLRGTNVRRWSRQRTFAFDWHLFKIFQRGRIMECRGQDLKSGRGSTSRRENKNLNRANTCYMSVHLNMSYGPVLWFDISNSAKVES